MATPQATDDEEQDVSWTSVSVWKLVLYGQVLALVLSGTGAFSAAIADLGEKDDRHNKLNIPATQMLLTYTCIACVFLPIYLYKQRRVRYERFTDEECEGQHEHEQKRRYDGSVQLDATGPHDEEDSQHKQCSCPHPDMNTPLVVVDAGDKDVEGGALEALASALQQKSPSKSTQSAPWWYYALTGLADASGNYLLVRSYQYTNVASVQLLDSSSIPWVMVMSRYFLRHRYRWLHLLGVAVCILGLTGIVVHDAIDPPSDNDDDSDDGDGDKSVVLGDILVLCGCVFYAISNVAQEFLVTRFDMLQFMAKTPVFGAIFSALLIAIFETHSVHQVDWGQLYLYLYLVGFALCMLTFYTGVPLLMQRSSAVFVNISLLTADFFALLLAWQVFHHTFSVWYLLFYGVTVVGLVTYNSQPVVTGASP